MGAETIRQEEWELIGAVIGDGNLYSHKKHYRVHLTGHPKKDRNYYEYLKELIRKCWGKKARIKVRQRALRLTVYSKEVYEKLKKLGIPEGREKHKKVTIPKMAWRDEGALKKVIRGIADTDGSVFISDKKRAKAYPSVEITTSSKTLACEIRSALNNFGFRVANLRRYKSKKSRCKSYKVSLYGKTNLEKWMKEIGFSNPSKREKALLCLVGSAPMRS
ncbi:hypothetical protein DRN62_01995 [Nanoarchaeota archaeon]|nr:MAG: hypothetical protein DRN62_01995 [Nanoarchaeota archaeon]